MIPHDLGVIPDNVAVSLVNIVAEAGYSIGDIIQIAANGENNGGISITKTATNLTLRTGNSGYTDYVEGPGAAFDVTQLNAPNWNALVVATVYGA